ncbi:MAG: exodeoxyribonuclease III [Hyphomonadaceae bacterium]|nr:exodeoxyribonuclease III [Hyphomonadaceae bacterium]
MGRPIVNRSGVLFFVLPRLDTAAGARHLVAMLKIATWNINSVRLRAASVARFLVQEKPHVLCLQEIKCRNGEFPSSAFAEVGYKHMHVVGQKGWHGVAFVSKVKIEPVDAPDLCRHGEARAAAIKVDGIEVHNLYVPAGADIPDPEVNPKFAHKLDVLARMRKEYKARKGKGPLVIVGDLNVAPGEHDVWSHKQLLDVVSHTPVETDAMKAIIKDGGFVDLARAHRPDPEKLFSWWSYRSPDWTANNRGRRLDHIWASADLAPASQAKGFRIHVPCRSWEKPSDHVPVVAGFKL